jgi:hypothetical protein
MIDKIKSKEEKEGKLYMLNIINILYTKIIII